MRTTLDLDKPVLDALKALQRREKRPLSQIASRLLAEALHPAQQCRAKQPAIRWIAKPMRARVDLSDKEALHRLLDQP